MEELKLTLLHGCFSRFLNCTNATKSRNASHLGIDDWDFTLLQQCETHKQLKEREKPFGSYGLKRFTHQILMRKRSTYISIYESQTNNYEGILAQFQFYQLFNYQFVKVYVLVYVCICLVVLQLGYQDRHFYSDSMFLSLLRNIVIYHYLYS